AQNQQAADLGHMNEHNRNLYYAECLKLIDQINKHVPAGQTQLYVPDLRFNRHIGEFANQPYSVTGELLSTEKHSEHLKEVLPHEEDVKLVMDIQNTEPKWVAPKGSME
ncbi:MAG: hypothetical protein WAN10_06055, partial [Candidatus Acidiferrales bacterium]